MKHLIVCERISNYESHAGAMKRLRMNVALSNPMRSEAPELLCRIINVGKGSVTCDSQSDVSIQISV